MVDRWKDGGIGRPVLMERTQRGFRKRRRMRRWRWYLWIAAALWFVRVIVEAVVI